MSDSRVSSLASGSIGGGSSMSYALPAEVECLVKKEGFQKRRTNLGFIVGISVCLSIASLLLVVAAAGWLLLNDALSTQLANLQDEVCLPCTQLTSDPVADLLSPLPDGLEVIKDNNDLKICCASTNAQLAALFKLVSICYMYSRIFPSLCIYMRCSLELTSGHVHSTTQIHIK